MSSLRINPAAVCVCVCTAAAEFVTSLNFKVYRFKIRVILHFTIRPTEGTTYEQIWYDSEPYLFVGNALVIMVSKV